MTRKAVIVIGGGMAGMVAAAHAASEHINVILLERNPALGKKLLISGSGQCNITHAGDIRDFLTHYGSHSRFLKPALLTFPNTYLIDYFEKRGVSFAVDENQKTFPASYKAIDIRNRLLDACVSLGVDIRSCARALSVKHANERFAVSGDSFSHGSDVIVVATGGMSYPETGSSGDGYAIAESLGHTIERPRPCLTPVYSDGFTLGELAGISFRGCTISLFRDGRKKAEYSGDLLVTHTGLSGPVILDNSRYMREGDEIEVAFISESDAQRLAAELVARIPGEAGLHVKTLLARFGCPKRLVSKLMELSGIHEDTACSNLEREKRKILVRLARGFHVRISALGGFDVAFTTAGGVVTEEINPQTLESRIVKNLFFAGEVIDYDGDTGGYGLQAAFSTGALCGSSIKKCFED